MSIIDEQIEWLRRFAAADTEDKLRAITIENAPSALVEISGLDTTISLYAAALGRVQATLGVLLGEPRG